MGGSSTYMLYETSVRVRVKAIEINSIDTDTRSSVQLVLAQADSPKSHLCPSAGAPSKL